MIKKIVLLPVLLLLVLTLTPLYAQDKETLAVLDFTTEAVSETDMSAIVEFLSAELFKTNKYTVIDVTQRQTILSEMEFSMSGCSDESCALEIGKMLSAELIVVGNLSKIGSRYLMSAKMLETESSKTIGTANGKYADLDEMIDGLESIAVSLAGQELTYAEPEAEPEALAEPVKQLKKEKPMQAASDYSQDNFNWTSFALSALGVGTVVTTGVFSSLAVSDLLTAREVYDNYMLATTNVGELYSGDGDTDYEHYYGLYERDSLVSLITSGLSGALPIASQFNGDNELSLGGKFTSAAGAFCTAAGKVFSSLSTNNAVANIKRYENYMLADNEITADALYSEYNYYHRVYTVERSMSYGLWGLGGAAAIGSYFLPGAKTVVNDGLLNKIISSSGYLLLAVGDYTNLAAFNRLILSEDSYDNYMGAGNVESSEYLYKEYEKYFFQYQLTTYLSYGLWAAGTAAVITSLFLPAADDSVADFSSEIKIRPALAGIGFEVDISLR